MKFQLQNQYLSGAIELMQRLPLTGYDSMARTRFIKLLKEPFDELWENQKALLSEYVLRGENGEPVVNGNHYKLIPDKAREYQAAYNKINSEVAEIDKATYTKHQEDIQRILRNSTLTLSGDDATIYAALCEALEVNFNE